MTTDPVPYLRLGVNIDHVATIRNARGGNHPDPVRAAMLAAQAGADGITAHLREDRRHISDRDIERLKADIDLPLNLEMAATDEMRRIALRHRPNACCLVPERRQELTTEGGLDVAGQLDWLAPFIADLQTAGIRVSLFVDPAPVQIEAARTVNADIVELHTGAYVEAFQHAGDLLNNADLKRIILAAEQAAALGLEVHAGHGLTYDTVAPVAERPEIVELNIGHFLVGEALFGGLDASIRRMRSLMDRARATINGQNSCA